MANLHAIPNLKKIERLLSWASSIEQPHFAIGKQARAIEALRDYVESIPLQRVLEIGSGKVPSPMSEVFASRGIEFIGYDIFPIADILGDMHDLPFPDKSFDLVVSRHSLEHSLIPYLAFQEMARVGEYVLAVLPSDSPRCHKSPGHLYVMTRMGWESLFTKLGAKVIRSGEGDLDEGNGQMEWVWLLKT